MENVQQVQVELSAVQETLLLPLWSRAIEMRNAHPIVRDPYACDFVERITYDYEQLAQKYATMQMLWPIRANTFDQVLAAYIAEHPRATIINLGAGLDTTFYRVDNGQIKWYDVDLPEVIALRHTLMKAPERVQYVTGSVLEDDWLTAVEPTTAEVFFLAGGLLMYLKAEDVQGLLHKIGKRHPGAEMLLDYIAPFFVQITRGKYQWGIWSVSEIAREMDEMIEVVQEWRYYDQFPERWGWMVKLLKPLVVKLNGMAHIRFE